MRCCLLLFSPAQGGRIGNDNRSTSLVGGSILAEVGRTTSPRWHLGLPEHFNIMLIIHAYRATFSQIWRDRAKFGRNRPCLTDIEKMWSKSGRICLTPVIINQNRQTHGRTRAKFDRRRANLSTDPGSMLVDPLGNVSGGLPPNSAQRRVLVECPEFGHPEHLSERSS